MLTFEHDTGFQKTKTTIGFMSNGKLKIQFLQEYDGAGRVVFNSTLLTEEETKQLANFIVAYYKGKK